MSRWSSGLAAVTMGQLSQWGKIDQQGEVIAFDRQGTQQQRGRNCFKVKFSGNAFGRTDLSCVCVRACNKCMEGVLEEFVCVCAWNVQLFCVLVTMLLLHGTCVLLCFHWPAVGTNPSLVERWTWDLYLICSVILVCAVHMKSRWAVRSLCICCMGADPRCQCRVLNIHRGTSPLLPGYPSTLHHPPTHIGVLALDCANAASTPGHPTPSP